MTGVASSATLPARLATFAQVRHDRFVATSIEDLFSDAPAFLEVPESLPRLLMAQRSALRRLLPNTEFPTAPSPTTDALTSLMTFNTRRFLKNNIQFARLSPDQDDALAALYRGFLAAFCQTVDAAGASSTSVADDLPAHLTEHRRNLRRFVSSLGGAAFPLDPRRRPLCRECSAELQIALLGLDQEPIAQPVLDLGCGEGATLVRFLRQRGVAAFGVDAFGPTGESFLIGADWLDLPLGRARWGTVLSHLAFSHHLGHHLLTGDDALAVYAARYRQMLESLRPGGRFVYAPALPWLEQLLPRERFHVERRPLPDPRRAVCPANRDPDPLPFAVARVERLAQSSGRRPNAPEDARPASGRQPDASAAA